MFWIRIAVIAILALFFTSVPIGADFLPNATPENQQISITTLIDVISSQQSDA